MIKNLQSLRALAAFLVAFVHLEQLWRTLGVAPFGGVGVDLFFVISGFIMVHVTRGRRITPAAFAKNRIARIVPLYWLLTFGVFILALVQPSMLQASTADPLLLLKSLLFVPFEKSNGLVQPLLFVGWTLNYEMFFYALFALGLTFRRYGLGLAATVGVIVVLVVYGMVARPRGVLAGFYTDPIMIDFALGIGVALLAPKAPAVAGAAVRAATCAATVLCLVGLIAVSILWPSNALSRGLLASGLVLGAVALERWNWSVNAPLLLTLGAASYALYLSHPFVTQAVQRLGMSLDPGRATSVALILLALTLVSLAAIAIHHLVEKPLSAAARRLLLGPGFRTQAAAC